MKRDLSSNMSVKDVLEQYPETLQLFLDMKLKCVGCPTEEFHTLKDVAREYSLDLDQLLKNLKKVIEDR